MFSICCKTMLNQILWGSVCSFRLRKERSERKAAAIERSKQRQADHDYFLSKKLLNVQEEVRACLTSTTTCRPSSFSDHKNEDGRSHSL